MFNNISENPAFRTILWKNIVEPEKPQMTIIERMRFACRIPKATNT